MGGGNGGDGGRGVGGGGGCTQLVHGRSRMTIDSRMCWDGERRVFTNQADIACTKREAPEGVRRVA